jgi:hypothetical protein
MNNEYFYFSPEEAKKELLRRRSDEKIKKRILEYLDLGGNIPKNLPKEPFLAMARFVATARIEDFVMYELSKKLGLYPLWLEYTWDKFHPQNVDKVDLVQIKIIDEGMIINIVGEEPEKLKGQKINEIKTTIGIDLVKFHHYIREGVLPQNYIDISMWLKSNGQKAKNYYFQYLKLFLVHGILLENFHVQGQEEEKFIRQVFERAFTKIKEEIGLVPIVIQQKWKREDGYYPPTPTLRKLIIKHLL